MVHRGEAVRDCGRSCLSYLPINPPPPRHVLDQPALLPELSRLLGVTEAGIVKEVVPQVREGGGGGGGGGEGRGEVRACVRACLLMALPLLWRRGDAMHNFFLGGGRINPAVPWCHMQVIGWLCVHQKREELQVSVCGGGLGRGGGCR